MAEKWLEYALDQRRPEAPLEIRADIPRRVNEALDGLRPSDSERTVKLMIDNVLDRALQAYRHREQAQQVVDAAVRRLPHFNLLGADAAKQEARQAAAQAIAELGEGATASQMDQAVARALAPMRIGLERVARCLQCAAQAFFRDSTIEERKQAIAAIQKALVKLDPGCSDAEMKRVRDQEAARIQSEIRRHRADEMRGSVLQDAARSMWWLPEAAKQSALTELREALDNVPNATRFDMDQVKNAVLQRHEMIEEGSQQILPELKRMQQNGTFNQPLRQVEQELRPLVREFLEKKIQGHERPDEVAQMVRGFVRRNALKSLPARPTLSGTGILAARGAARDASRLPSSPACTVVVVMRTGSPRTPCRRNRSFN